MQVRSACQPDCSSDYAADKNRAEGRGSLTVGANTVPSRLYRYGKNGKRYESKDAGGSSSRFCKPCSGGIRSRPRVAKLSEYCGSIRADRARRAAKRDLPAKLHDQGRVKIRKASGRTRTSRGRTAAPSSQGCRAATGCAKVMKCPPGSWTANSFMP